MSKILVVSDMIRSLEYNPELQELTVEYSPANEWIYSNIPLKMYQHLLAIDHTNKKLKKQTDQLSLGSIFHYMVKIHDKLYPSRKKPIDGLPS